MQTRACVRVAAHRGMRAVAQGSPVHDLIDTAGRETCKTGWRPADRDVMISACQGEGLGRIHSGASRCVHKGGAPGFPSHVQHPEPGPAAKSQMKRVAVHILTDCRQCLEDWVPYGTASSAGSASALDSPESDL